MPHAPRWIRAVVALPCVALVVAACGGSSYDVVKEDGPHVTLLVQDATKDTAQAAIKDYLDLHTGASDSPSYLDIEVVTSASAKTYVCRSRYFADRETAAQQAGNPDISTEGYPASTMNCPT